MEKDSSDTSTSPPVKAPEDQPPSGAASNSVTNDTSQAVPSKLSSWAKSLKIPQPLGVGGTQEGSSTENSGKSSFSRFTSGLGLRLSPKAPSPTEVSDGSSADAQPGIFGTITKGIVDSSKSAVKAVQVKARHAVSQNKRRYQEGGFDLDMSYITENIIAMGFPAGDMSSGFFGYVEGFYRNHMEEVIKFFETHHKGKYKVYNLCSERLYDASLFEGKLASFPFDDHNSPPIQLIISFCLSAYSWLKEDIENVVVVHCKAGMARTGLMISSLLLYLKFFPTAEESMDYYNQKRCVDGKGLILPSQIVCQVLHRCPYWIRPSITISDHNGVLFSTKKHPRTKDLSPEDYWFSAPKKGVMVFALPGEPGLTELDGDFKIHFHDRQGDFYCWLNTTMTENRKILTTSELDGFDKRKLPSPGFQVEIVLVDYNGNVESPPRTESNNKKADEEGPQSTSSPNEEVTAAAPKQANDSENQDKDDVFSDNEAEESGSKIRRSEGSGSDTKTITTTTSSSADTKSKPDQVTSLTKATEQVSIGNPAGPTKVNASGEPKTTAPAVAASSESEFKAMAADASVFSFGDEEDFESE